MSDTQTVELTQEQCEILKRGLRFVRSAVMLEISDPAERDDDRRNAQLQQIASLSEQLNQHKARNTATRV